MRRALAFWVVLWAAAPVAGAERDPMAMFSSGGTGQTSSVDYTFHDSFGGGSSSGDSPVITDHRLRGNFIVSKSETDTWSIQQNASHLNLTESPTIPETGLHIPDSLWDIETGADYAHQLGDRREWGLRGSVGSASDRPFYTIHETVIRATAHYRIPSGVRNSWIFLLSYSNNRHFFNNVPIPGFAYFYRDESGRLQAALGFPFLALSYKPDEDWAMRLSLFGPRNLSAQISRKLAAQVSLYTGFEWGQQEWLRANRDDNANQIFFDQKRLLAGLRFPIYKTISLDLSGGREFDRRFYENRSSNSNVPRASLANSWFLETRLSWRAGF